MATQIDVGDWLSRGTPKPTDPCGLFVQDGGPAVPLRSRVISATVHCEQAIADVTETFSYVSDDDVSVRFVFPLAPRSAVYRFHAKVGDREVVTEVKRRAEARAEFNMAVQQGHTAALMQQEEGASLFSVDLGNLGAMEECEVSFSYVRVLDTMAGCVEFVHQATWVPPYLNAHDLAQGAQQVAASNPKFAAKVSYTLSYSVRLVSERGFASIDCPIPGAVTKQEGEGGNMRLVTLDQTVSDPSKDFSLLVELAPLAAGDKASAGHVCVQECMRQGKTKTVALATFMPQPVTQKSEGQAPGKCEVWMVVDGSGSMGGEPIRQAKEAALFLIKDLPTSAGVSFNVVVFGDRHEMMWPAPRPYDASTEAEAVAWCQGKVHANWGGTEILSALAAIYAVPLPQGTTRQIVFLTDGGVNGGEEQRIYDLVEKGSMPTGGWKLGSVLGSGPTNGAHKATTVFSLGIGHGVHRGLVEGVAKKSGGVAQFVVDGEPIGKKCAFLKRCALAAGSGEGCLIKPRLVGNMALVRAAPNVLPPRIFAGEPFPVLVELLKHQPGSSLELVAQLPDGSPFRQTLPLDGAPRVQGEAFAVLHAMACVGALMAGTSPLHCAQDGEALASQPTQQEVTDTIVSLAVAEHLVTPHTSAVGVLLLKNPLDPSAVRRTEVPLQVPSGRTLWQQDQQQQQQQHAYGGAVPCMSASASMLACQAQPMAMAFGGPGGNAHGGGGGRGGGGGDVMYRMCAKKSSGPSGMFGAALRGVTGTIGGMLNFGAAPSAAPPPPPVLFGAAASSPPPSRPSAACPAPASAPYPAPASPCCDAEEDDMALAQCVAAPASAATPIYVSAADEDEEMEASISQELFAPEGCAKEEACKEAEKSPKGGQQQEVKHKRKVHAKQQQQQQQQLAVHRSTDEVLAFLNLSRSVEGFWPASDEVMAALASQQAGPDDVSSRVQALRDAAPPELCAEDSGAVGVAAVWATLLALAFLRKHLAAQRATWEGMEAKATEWLRANWPAAAAGRSIGSMVLAGMKLV